MKTTDKILDALNKLLKDKGWSKRRLAVELELSSATVIKWFNRNGIRDSIWSERVEPLLRPYLNNTYRESNIPKDLIQSYKYLKSLNNYERQKIEALLKTIIDIEQSKTKE